MTSSDIQLPDDYFASIKKNCQIYAPKDFDFGADISSGDFIWYGGNFFISDKKEAYVEYSYNKYGCAYSYTTWYDGEISWWVETSSWDGIDWEEYQNNHFHFYYDNRKKLRENRSCDVPFDVDYLSNEGYNASLYILQTDSYTHYGTIEEYLDHGRYIYYPYDFYLEYDTIYVTIDSSFADYYPTEPTDEWFDFYFRSQGGEAEEFSTWNLFPSEKVHITGLEYLNEPRLSPYALLSSDKTTLTFYCDYKQQVRSEDVTTYSLNDNSTSPTWLSEKENITKVVFDPSFADARPVITRLWFNGMSNLEIVEGLNYLNTSEVTSMYSMFSGCSKLDSLDLSTFDTSQTTSMTGMFNNCTSLKYLNLSSFDLSSATSIRLMFQNCTSLESVDLSAFDTSSVTDLRNLFYGCTSLKGLDLSTMEIADGAQTGNMFYGCKSLKSLKISFTFGRINSNACTGVGTTSTPCRVYAPEGFSFGTDTSGESFKWKGGYFKLGIDPTISVGEVTAYTGVNAEASLSLTIGHDDYTGYQFDIVLPQGMSLVNTQSGFKYKLSSRFNGDGVSCAIRQQNDGSYRAICYSTNHKTISGTEGVLITFPVVADETVAAGAYTGHIRNFTLNDIGNNSIHVPDVEFSLTVLDAATGDVNHDGCVDISDVLLTVDYILGKTPANYIPSDGDINHDGEINISDVLSIVDIILGQNSYNAPINARTSTVDDLTLLRKDNIYTLCLDNHEPYSGFQIQLSLPDGSTLRNASLVADRADGHRLVVRDHGDGTYTLIAYASDGRQLLDSGTPLLRLTVNGTQGNDDVQMNNILFSILQRETVLLPDVNGTATGMINIATDNNDTAPAYNIQGQRVSPNYRGLVISCGKKRIRK